MTPPKRADEPDREQVETELERVVARAREEGIRLDGAYDVRSPYRDDPDYTIEITEIAKRRPSWMGGNATN